MEASTNLIGGQPFSMKNLKEVRAIANEFDIPLVLDASLIGRMHTLFSRERRNMKTLLLQRY